MKKITLIFICIVFIASVLMVNFFGLEYKVYNEYIFANKIEIQAVQVGPSSQITKQEEKNGTLWIYVTFTQNYDSNDETKTAVMLVPRILPDNTSDKSLNYVYDKNYTKAYFIEDAPIPTIVFKEMPTAFTFSLRANDNGGAETKIRIIATLDLVE